MTREEREVIRNFDQDSSAAMTEEETETNSCGVLAKKGGKRGQKTSN